MKKIRILLLRRWYMVGGAALLAAAAVFYAVNYPAAVSTAATTRQLPIYSVERAQKVCAISFDAAWGEGKVRHRCREREQDRAINAWGIRLSSLNTHQGKAAKSPCRRFCSFLVFYYAQLAHTASAMGEVAAENICGHEAHYCEKTNPTCVYMEPEAASAGLTEEQCKAQGIAYKVGKFPMSANGKALILNGGEGLVKIIAGAEYGEILGMHIIGSRATDLIAEGALAIEGEMTLDEIIDTIHSHPTVTETMREAALNAEKRAIHTKN